MEQVGAEIVVETLLWLEAEIESVCTFSLRENALVFRPSNRSTAKVDRLAERRVSPFCRHAATPDSEPSARPPARHVHSIATMAAMMTSMVPVTLRTATPASSASTGENASRPDSDAR